MRNGARHRQPGLILVALLAALVAAAPAGEPQVAADGQAGPAPKPAPIGMVAVRSLDAVAALAKELNVPLPPQVSAREIEKQFPFIGPGGLAADQPAGILFVGGEITRPEQAVVFALPVKPGAATLEKLKQMGGRAMAGRTDAVVINNVGMRRTAGHLLFAPRAEAVGVVDVEAMAAAFQRPEALAVVSVDLKAIRTTSPALYEKFVAGLEQGDQNLPPGNPAREAGRQAGRALRAEFGRIDRVSLAVDHGGNVGLRLAATVQPLKLPAAQAAAVRPGLPPNTFFRLDLAFSPGDALKGPVDAMTRAALESAEKDGKALTPPQRRQLEALLKRVANLVGSPQATTVGVELAGEAPVVYLVNQYAKPFDYSAELRQAAAGFNAFAKGAGEAVDPVDVRSYAIGDQKVLRLRLVERGKAIACIDAAQRGQQVMVAIAPGEFRYVDRLLSAKAEGPMQAPAAGSLDLGKLFEAATKMPGSPVAAIPEDQRKQLGDILRGQRVTLTASAQGDAATFSVTLPPGLVRNVPRLVEMLKGSEDEAKVAAAKAHVAQIETALDVFEVDAGRYPSQFEGLNALTAKPAGVQAWKGPYVKNNVPADPWGRPYVYRFPGTRNLNGYDLFSVGPDGREGGGDDVTNW